MNLDRYEYRFNEDFSGCEFFSEGPKGRIRKFVKFAPVTEYPYSYFNLSFGDAREDGAVDDSITSDNHDADKILATIAAVVLDFTSVNPAALILAEGSTPARTRRYQMGINKYWNIINTIFDVYGLDEGARSEPFQRGKNYNGFAVKRKIINL